ncbi:MAG: toll/interleukin-1 receptor domain-containing protein, partial [Gaiellaceae bacterium]
MSYRREDAPAYAGRLYDQLAERFGDENVFMDVDTIEPGADFVARIEDAVSSAAALLVVVGRGWVDAKDDEGRRRLDDPEDFVRLEVASALQRDVTVIPVLVGGATMPESDQLPAALAGLARRNALVLSDLDWRAGMTRLLAVLEPQEEERQEEQQQEEERVKPPRIPTAATALGIAGAALLVLGTLLQVDTFAHPDFGPADRDGLGFFTSLAPMGIAVGAVAALLLSFSRGAGALANGLVLGFALGGVARYVAVLGAASSSPAEEGSRLVGGSVLALAGCLLLAAAALWRATAGPA